LAATSVAARAEPPAIRNMNPKTIDVLTIVRMSISFPA